MGVSIMSACTSVCANTNYVTFTLPMGTLWFTPPMPSVKEHAIPFGLTQAGHAEEPTFRAKKGKPTKQGCQDWELTVAGDILSGIT